MKQQFYKTLLKAGVFALVLMSVSSCRDAEIPTPPETAHSYDNDVYHEWVQSFLTIERYARGYRPGPAPRALAYLNLAAYECTVPGIPENNSMRIQYPDLDLPDFPSGKIHYPAAINASYAYLMERFFFHMELERPEEFALILLTYERNHNRYLGETTPEVLEASEKWGEEVAQAVYEWSRDDVKGHNAFLDPQPVDYVPPAGAGKYKAMAPNFARAVFPYWGDVRTFAVREEDKIGRAPIPYSTVPGSLYRTQVEEVYNTVKFIRENPNNELAYDLKWQGEFWSDDLLNVTFSPPPRLFAIADQIVEREDIDLAQAAELYAKLGLALHDNGVIIWKTKYHYNIERPITAIREILGPSNPDAANWVTQLNVPGGPQGVTPAFPAYPSGHSGFGGCGSKILSSFFEYTPEHPGTYTFTDMCHNGRVEFLGMPRTFNSIEDSGVENALSRIPLGVHFRMDCDEGLRMGRVAAQRVLELPWKK
jgi:hypothetical protein